MRRYEHRPGEELYDLSKDPYEWNNLAEDTRHAEVKAELRGVLLAWMKEMGDQGQQAELDAIQHQTRSLKKSPQPMARSKKAKRKKAS